MSSATERRGRLRREWVLAFVSGELVGFVPPALVGATLAAAGVSDTLLVWGLTAAGSLEGAALGTAQALVLRRHVPGVSTRGWIVATAVAAAFAWLVGMSAGTQLGSTGDQPGWLLAMLSVAVLAGLFGMGFAQWLVLRLAVPRSARWIPVTAVSWLVGVSIPVVAISAVPDALPPLVHAAIGVAAAILMGVTVAVITGATLHRLVSERFQDQGDRGPPASAADPPRT